MVHDEKIDHAVSRLNDAGLSDDDSVAIHSSTSNDTKKYAIIGGVVGGIVLLVLVVLAIVIWRRRQKRKAYQMVHREAEAQRAPSGPGMTGGLMPLWMTQKQPGASRDLAPPAGESTEKLRRYSTSGRDDVFNADRETESTESDSLNLNGNKFAERNFESGYDTVDTGYGAPSGDKRSNIP